MSSWMIQCSSEKCGEKSWPENIVDLVNNYKDAQGWIVCGACGCPGYIQKQYDVQEGGQFQPYLKAILQPDYTQEGYTEIYRPFAFLASYGPDEPLTDIWFVYYKDMREYDGRLKMGHGPGGPPIFFITDIVDILSKMLTRGDVSEAEVKKRLGI